ILDFARTTEPQFAPVNLNQVIEELGLLVRHKLKNQNVQLVRKLQASLPPVMGEAGQIEQAFLNLILNAVEAMPQGGILTIVSRPVFLPRAAAQPTYVAVEFADTGSGMTQEQRRRAFTSILTTTKARG